MKMYPVHIEQFQDSKDVRIISEGFESGCCSECCELKATGTRDKWKNQKFKQETNYKKNKNKVEILGLKKC
jgi:hypothetical protein